jgi:hypothetical protein
MVDEAVKFVILAPLAHADAPIGRKADTGRAVQVAVAQQMHMRWV